MQASETPFGRIEHVAPAAHLSETPPFWARPAVPLGTDEAAWTTTVDPAPMPER